MSERPPGKHINVDETGVSMSWRTAILIGAALVSAAFAWNAFTAKLVKSGDLQEHNKAKDAHAAQLDAIVKPLKAKVDTTEKAALTVKNGFYEQRAEDLAYRATENMSARSTQRERISKFNDVKKKALENLNAGRDIREGVVAPTL